MPIICLEQWYTRQYLRSNPDILFVWGDNLARVGGANNPKSGQAYACRGEPNAIGIPTKKYPSMDESSFFTDQDFETVKPHIDSAFRKLGEHLFRGGTVIWPYDDIGTGRAQLPTRAPRIWRYIQETKNILLSMNDRL